MSIRLVTATPSLAASEAYFERLGFTRAGDTPVLYTAGAAVVEIDPARTARPGLRLFRSDLAGTLEALIAFGPLHDVEGGRMIAAPSGTWVHLMDGEAPAIDAKGTGSALGTYAGISLESARIADSTRFWEALGLEVTAGGPDQGWLSLTNGDGVSVSLMKPFVCPHSFANPSLTFFNSGKNPEVIAEIRRREIPIYEEVTAFNPDGEVENVILREPGGLGFFVFND